MAKLSLLTLPVVVVAMATLFEVSLAQTTPATVTCYSCSSITDSNCGDPFKGSPTATNTCSGQQCYKTVTTLSGTSVTRGCTIPEVNVCTAANLLPNTQCSLCTGNNCNAATGIYPGHVTTGLVLAMAMALTFIGGRLL